MAQNDSVEKFGKPLSIPDEFPEILKAFTRECLRIQPDDLLEFGEKYFSALAASEEAAADDDELSLEEIEKIVQELFNTYDADGNGHLDRREFRTLLEDLSTRIPFMSEDDMWYFLAEADSNADNKIEYHEFIPIALQIIQTMYAKKKQADKQEKVQEEIGELLVHGMDREELMSVLETIFTSFDADGSGSLSREEFTSALSSMELGLTRREVNSLLFQVDANEDGAISYQEFLPFAFDLLRKLTEMRIFETEMAEDELAQFLMDMFRSKDEELGMSESRAAGTLDADMVKDLLAEARLGLTRLQIYSVLSVAELNEAGCLNYTVFIPKAVGVIRNMLKFEGELVDQVSLKELAAECVEKINALTEAGTTKLADVQAALQEMLSDGCICCDPEQMQGVMLAAKHLSQGDVCDTKALAKELPLILKNATKLR